MKLKYQVIFLALSLLAAGLTGCKSESVVSDSSKPASSGAPQTSTSQAGSNSAATAPAATPATAPAAGPSQQPSPAPTLLPVMKQAQANPGVPVSVPDSMRRPLNPEEMKKAMDQLPPEVRARIQGMQAAPQGVQPQATPKKQ